MGDHRVSIAERADQLWYKLIVNPLDRVSPTVRRVAGATAGITAAVAYTHIVRAAHARRTLLAESEWLQ